MTDSKPTTNEEIALLRKWKRAPSNMMGGWIDPNGIELGWVETPPDFEHEWAHAGPLLEELLAAECISGYSTAEGKWEFHLGMHAPDERCDTLTEAISHVWLAWKKEDHE